MVAGVTIGAMDPELAGRQFRQTIRRPMLRRHKLAVTSVTVAEAESLQ